MPLGLKDTQGAVLLPVMPQAARDTQLCGFAPQVRVQGFGLGFRTCAGIVRQGFGITSVEEKFGSAGPARTLREEQLLSPFLP